MPDETPPRDAAPEAEPVKAASEGESPPAPAAEAGGDASGGAPKPDTAGDAPPPTGRPEPEPAAAADDDAAAKKAKAVAAAKAAAAKKAAAPKRDLPTEEQLAAWIGGDDLPSLSNLFNLLNTKMFDGKVALIKKEELLPQHWQVIRALEPPDDEEFERLPEVARLRSRLADPAVRERRVAALKVGWEELRGKRPALWNASDVFGALRRIIDRKREVDFHDFLSAARDVWRDLTLPHGREQLEQLWACLDLVRSKTKK